MSDDPETRFGPSNRNAVGDLPKQHVFQQLKKAFPTSRKYPQIREEQISSFQNMASDDPEEANGDAGGDGDGATETTAAAGGGTETGRRGSGRAGVGARGARAWGLAERGRGGQMKDFP